jgi:hypothetical protein
MLMMRSRALVVAAAVAGVGGAAFWAMRSTPAQAAPAITVYKGPT